VKGKKLLASLKSSKFRHGGYATLMILAVVAIVVVVNLVVDQIPFKIDLTQNRLFSLSDGTKKLLADLKTDVTITSLAKAGQEDPVIKEILDKYARDSRHVKLATIDPEKNPAWAKQYDKEGNGLREGSIVVQAAGGKKWKAIDRYDLYNIDYSNPNQQPQVTSLAVEQRVTSAVQYVTTDRNPTIYAVQGHGEDTLNSYGLNTPLENANYVVKDLNLLSASSVPADADVVVLLNPKSDLSAGDAEKLRTYLQAGGRMMALLNPPVPPNLPLPNLDELLKSYGIAMRRLVVVEGDANSRVGNNPLYFLPKLEYHDVLATLRKGNIPILWFGSEAIDTLDLKRKTIKVEPLLTTSQNSWAKIDYSKISTFAKEKGDAEGPFTVAVAVTDTPSDPKKRETRLVVTGSSSFLRQDLAGPAPGNIEFFIDGMGWLRETKDVIVVPPKSLTTMRLRISSLQAMLLSGVTVILMPLLVLGAGFVVWMRRRHL
jgi:ABC-2 type transport system permease protein